VPGLRRGCRRGCRDSGGHDVVLPLLWLLLHGGLAVRLPRREHHHAAGERGPRDGGQDREAPAATIGPPLPVVRRVLVGDHGNTQRAPVVGARSRRRWQRIDPPRRVVIGPTDRGIGSRRRARRDHRHAEEPPRLGLREACGRVRRGVQQWKETGKLPGDVAAADPRTAAAVDAPALAVQRKPTPRASGAAEGAGAGGSPTDVLASLGEGRPLESGTAARMGRAFDTSFADVRIHDDETGGAVAQQQDALAFTVGKHVAFAPGKYNPGSPEGDALLAHELTHVMQQRGETSGGGATAGSGAEVDADRAAADAVKHLHAGSAEKAAPRASSDFQLQRCAGNPAETGLITTDLKGQFLDRKVGSTSSTVSSGISYTLDTDIKAARTLGGFDTEAAALAAVKTNGKPGAVTIENAKYVAYETDIGFGYRKRTDPVIGSMSGGSTTSRAPKLAPGVIALVSNEMMTVRAGEFDPGAGTDAQGSADKQLSSAANPFDGYKQALGGEQGDLNTLSDDKLIAAFHAAMKDTALVVLNKSSEQVKAKQSRFDKGGAGLSDTEFEAMKATAQELADDDGKIAGVKKTLADLNMKKAMASGPAGGYVSTLHDKDIAAAQANLAQIETQRKIHLAKYPLLSRVEPAELLKLTTKEEMAGKLGGELPGILKDIETTKQNVADGKLNLWAVDQVVDATIAGFGLDEAKRKVIMDTKASEAKKKTIESVVFTVFAIGFGLAAAFVSGGAGLFFAAGAFGLSTYDAMKQTEQYMVDKPASNVALDKDGGFAAPPGWGWLVVAWIGAGLDAAQVASAVGKVAKAEVTVADAAKELAADAKRLGMTEEELLKKLRSLAGDIDGAAKVTEGAKGALAGKLGLPVDIDPKLAGDVRVFYEVDKATGRVTVKSLVAGPTATMAEVLAHDRLIQHMRRYEGVTGRLRELWEKLLAFVGKSPRDKNPFEAGSKAWESWNELYKLPDVVDAQFLKYRDGLRAGNESTLVKDLEILEDQARRHRSIIDEMVGEAGAGFVAKTGDSTRAAVAAGYPLPAGVSTAEELLAKGYYYRAGANGKYDLVRKTSAGVDQLRVEFDAAGKPVGLVKAVEKLETRITDAAQLQRLRALASDAEIARLYDKVGDAARLEKLLKDTGGVAKLETLLGKVAKPADLERLLKSFPVAELESIMAATKHPQHLAVMLEHMDTGSAVKMLRQWMAESQLAKMDQFLERMSQGAGKQLAETAKVGANSIILDSNTAIALMKDADPALRATMNNGEIARVAYIKGLPAGTELRVGNVAVGETGGKLALKGVPIDGLRDSAEYQKVLAKLESVNVGRADGFADRALVADAFFSKTEPGVTARFLTSDKRVVNGMARLATPPIDPSKVGGYPSILATYGKTGFNVTIESRTITILPVP